MLQPEQIEFIYTHCREDRGNVQRLTLGEAILVLEWARGCVHLDGPETLAALRLRVAQECERLRATVGIHRRPVGTSWSKRVRVLFTRVFPCG